MLRKLEAKGNGLFKWKIKLRMGDRFIHEHHVLTAHDAQQLYADLLNKKAREKHNLTTQTVSGQTLESAASAFQLHMQTLDKNARYLAQARKSIELLMEVKGLAPNSLLRNITRDHLIDWQKTRAQTPVKKKLPKSRTVNRSMAELAAFFTFCQKSGWLDRNPCHGIAKIKEAPSPEKELSWENYCKFADAVWKDRRDVALLVEVLAESGCRISEAIKAKAGDVNAQRQEWTRIVKGGTRKVFVAKPWTLEARKLAKDDNAPLLPRARDGKKFTYQTVKRVFKRCSKRVGISITPHYLRHGRATWDIDAGLHQRAVQRKLGHTSIQTTERYMRTAEQRDAESRVSLSARTPESVPQYATKARKGRTLKATKGTSEALDSHR